MYQIFYFYFINLTCFQTTISYVTTFILCQYKLLQLYYLLSEKRRKEILKKVDLAVSMYWRLFENNVGFIFFVTIIHPCKLSLTWTSVDDGYKKHHENNFYNLKIFHNWLFRQVLLNPNKNTPYQMILKAGATIVGHEGVN